MVLDIRSPYRPAWLLLVFLTKSGISRLKWTLRRSYTPSAHPPQRERACGRLSTAVASLSPNRLFYVTPHGRKVYPSTKATHDWFPEIFTLRPITGGFSPLCHAVIHGMVYFRHKSWWASSLYYMELWTNPTLELGIRRVLCWEFFVPSGIIRPLQLKIILRCISLSSPASPFVLLR